MRSVISTLADFVSAGLRPRTPLAKAITVALAVKIVVIVSMKIFLFSGDARPLVDETVMGRVFGPGAPAHRHQAPPPPAQSKASESLESARGSGG